jgi:hypothetical protein
VPLEIYKEFVMRIEGSALNANGFYTQPEALRAPAHSMPAGGDSVTLNLDASAAKAVSSMLSVNAGDALAAHGRLDPERALRLLDLLGD